MHFRERSILLLAGLVVAVLVAYSNHFGNGFHFDDTHAVTGNPALQDLRNIPRFFADGRLFSVLPEAGSYRPVVSSSLAIDYWLGKGYRPFFFHLSTFCLFALQLVLMFFLFRRIMQSRDGDATVHTWTALAATAVYGLHPACAETVNYIVQRGDLYNALGVVASLLWFVARPADRKYGWYLLPAIAAYLSKAPALIFPFILLAYVLLFDREALRDTAPAFVVTAAAVLLTWKMTPATFVPGAASAAMYRLTQPRVALHFFTTFFVPTGLNVDPAWNYVPPFSASAIAGYLFVAALLAAAWFTARRTEMRPIAFGIIWFFLAMIPTSLLLPLSDVTNDHRMFFPFVGLSLAVVWTIRIAVPAVLPSVLINRAPIVVALGIVLSAEAFATHQRNAVWHTEESLWYDATVKNPQNDRAQANYGNAIAAKGRFREALPYLDRALPSRPADSELVLALAMTHAGLHDGQAQPYFERAIRLASGEARPYCFYGHWLKDEGRLADAQRELEAALRLNPNYGEAQKLLAEVVVDRQRRGENPSATGGDTAEAALDRSSKFCRSGQYPECLVAAMHALELRPSWAEAYNNMAAALLSMQRLDEGIQAASQALALKPGYEAARSNLEWALEQKKKTR